MTTTLAAHGLAIGLPTGWEGRIQRRAVSVAAEQTHAVVHLANFALPEERDDFGGGVTPLMRSADVFVVLFEYGPDAVGKPLFATQGIPRVTADMFGSKRLQRPLPGQLGCQRFFTAHGRPFCLYVVAGSRAYLPRILAEVNGVLTDLDVAP
ncbi:MAG: hypothetical protein JWM72_938 [Actinomycetia bacterium]|jgi:hypothetical protein|nr:hypothetical protein [Actinomycetes bacterium]MDQ1460811.1 hypothetical protein [Actinomycetota bacterium]